MLNQETTNLSKNAIILGIDPGSCITGYGIIQIEGSQLSYLDSGCIKVSSAVFSERLEKIFTGLQTVVQQFAPNEAAVEQVFMHINPNAALKLGQARGAASSAQHGSPQKRHPSSGPIE